MKKKSNTSRYIIALAGFLFVCFSYYAYQIFNTANIQVKKENFYLYIPTGANFQTVLDSLEKNNVLYDRLSFAFVSKLLGYQENIKAGKYLLIANSTNLETVRKLRSGNQEAVKLTFNNLRQKQDLAAKLDEKLEFSAEDFLTALSSPDLLKKYGFNEQTVMAMFIPNTYQVFWNITAEDFIQRMHKEYTKFWNEDRLAKAKVSGYNPVEITIIASIVEAETNKDKEKSRVAGVYINRLKSGMPLQADPTVKFALQDFSIKRVTREHTTFDSPYNTYIYSGLPPGPINMPSTISIDAVLNYEKHSYLYFCASPTDLGYHDFAVSYTDHVNNANRYRRYLDTNKIF